MMALTMLWPSVHPSVVAWYTHSLPSLLQPGDLMESMIVVIAVVIIRDVQDAQIRMQPIMRNFILFMTVHVRLNFILEMQIEMES